MVRVSRFKLPDEVTEKLFDLFFATIQKSRDKKSFKKIMLDLLSPTERVVIVKRVAIIYLILRKVDYFTICKLLKVSPSTVAKFSLLMEKSDQLVPVLKSISHNKNLSIFFEELLVTILPPGQPGINWKAAWERKIQLNLKKQTGL